MKITKKKRSNANALRAEYAVQKKKKTKKKEKKSILHNAIKLKILRVHRKSLATKSLLKYEIYNSVLNVQRVVEERAR